MRLLMTLMLFIAPVAHAQNEIPLKIFTGTVVHHFNSSSKVTVFPGKWSDCNQLSYNIQSCKLTNAKAEIGDQTIKLTKGTYFPSTSAYPFSKYYFSGKGKVGGEEGKELEVKFVFVDGSGTLEFYGRLEVPAINLKEDIVR